MIIIGSHALNRHIKGYSTPNDMDFIGTEKDILAYCYNNGILVDKKKYTNLTVYCGTDANGKYYEFEVAISGRSSDDYLKYMNDTEGRLIYASLEVLYSLKKSHINFEIKFDKHIKVYHLLKDILIDDKLVDITTKRYNETKERLKVTLPKLNQSVQDFVSESQGAVKRIYDHDDIHRIMAHGNNPAYFKIQPDITRVWCSKELWNILDEQEKIEMVLEESYVIALERKIIPMLRQGGRLHTTRQAFNWALMRICTTLASGYFRQYAVDNYYKICDNYNANFVDKFLDAVERGDVKYHISHTTQDIC
jgi:hypothetical protein